MLMSGRAVLYTVYRTCMERTAHGFGATAHSDPYAISGGGGNKWAKDGATEPKKEKRERKRRCMLMLTQLDCAVLGSSGFWVMGTVQWMA